MPICDYCGCDNEPCSVFCKGCGSALITGEPAGKNVKPPPLPGEKRKLNARSATIILLVWLAGHLVGGLTAIAARVAVAGIGRTHNEAWPLENMTFTAAAFAIMTASGGGAMLLMALSMPREALTDTGVFGAAWVCGTPKQLASGLGAGIVLAMAYLSLAKLFGPGWLHGSSNPMERLASTKGISQLIFQLSTIVLAPLTEEPLFRGVLYGGYRRSFGPTGAAVLTTLIFVLGHVTGIIRFLPAIIGVVGMAILALWIRLRTAAIGPAITVHVGYNLMIAVRHLL